MFGYTGKILKIDLSSGKSEAREMDAGRPPAVHRRKGAGS